MSRGEGNVPSRWEPFSSAESAQAQVSGQQRREGGVYHYLMELLDIFKSGNLVKNKIEAVGGGSLACLAAILLSQYSKQSNSNILS